MKTWILALFTVLAAVDVVSSLAVSEHHEYENNIIKELFLDDCGKLEYIRSESVETLISTARIVQSCSKIITRVLSSSDGAVIIIGSDTSELALACLKLNANRKLFFNKYYDLPQSVQNLIEYKIFSTEELPVKVYTSRQVTVDKLRSLIIDSEYENAIEMTEYLFNRRHSDHEAGKHVVITVVDQILKEYKGYQIMEFAYKLFKFDENIVDECFPAVFLQIFNEQKVLILNKETTGILRLSTDIDSIDDRWLNLDCDSPNATEEDVYFKFSPVWDNSSNTLVYLFQNPFYGMKMKLDVNTVDQDERLAWGDKRQSDKRFSWRLMPVGYNERNQLLFRIEDTVYSSCLNLGSCSSANSKPHVKGSKESCNSDMGWVFENAERDNYTN